MKISPKETLNKMKDGAVLLDVRSPMEYDYGHIKGAINMPIEQMMKSHSSLIEDKEKEIIVYCASGSRTPFAVMVLNNFGYNNVYDLGSITYWPYEFEK